MGEAGASDVGSDRRMKMPSFGPHPPPTDVQIHSSPSSGYDTLDSIVDAAAAMAKSYKSLKEDFVSNLSGGGIWEINLVTAVAPVGTSQ